MDGFFYSLEEPSRVCLVCRCLENPNANTVNDNDAWLCERCRSTLFQVIEKENMEGE
mgnify:CR=1 FL=1